jgi:hypothetical protein
MEMLVPWLSTRISGAALNHTWYYRLLPQSLIVAGHGAVSGAFVRLWCIFVSLPTNTRYADTQHFDLLLFGQPIGSGAFKPRLRKHHPILGETQ